MHLYHFFNLVLNFFVLVSDLNAMMFFIYPPLFPRQNTKNTQSLENILEYVPRYFSRFVFSNDIFCWREVQLVQFQAILLSRLQEKLYEHVMNQNIRENQEIWGNLASFVKILCQKIQQWHGKIPQQKAYMEGRVSNVSDFPIGMPTTPESKSRHSMENRSSASEKADMEIKMISEQADISPVHSLNESPENILRHPIALDAPNIPTYVEEEVYFAGLPMEALKFGVDLLRLAPDPKERRIGLVASLIGSASTSGIEKNCQIILNSIHKVILHLLSIKNLPNPMLIQLLGFIVEHSSIVIGKLTT